MPMKNHNPIRFVLCLLLLALGHGAFAQGLSIDITDGSRTADPIAVVPFAFEGAGLPPDTDVAEIVRADLARSGKFFTLAKRDIVEFPTRESEVKFATWRLLKQNYLVVGRVSDAGDSALRVEFELFDVARQGRMIGLSISGQRTAMRDVAHQIADLIYEKILGVRGAFWTRIAYVTSVGLGQNTQYALMVADSDGFNPQTVVRSRELLSSQKGINGGPAFSPDGSRLAINLSYAGSPDIYIMDLASRKSTRLTSHFAIDVEAAWMPDGRSLVFTSDRSGKPQLYEVPASGGEASRLTFQGQYNARATICCDGKKIAMAQGTGNVYRITVFDRATGTYTEISPGNVDESPSFAPNGSMVLYAATEGPRGVLYAVSADGRVRQRLVLADGDVREPAWGPFRQR
jgi:TolB protein